MFLPTKQFYAIVNEECKKRKKNITNEHYVRLTEALTCACTGGHTEKTHED